MKLREKSKQNGKDRREKRRCNMEREGESDEKSETVMEEMVLVMVVKEVYGDVIEG